MAPRQLPGDAKNVHRREDDVAFYIIDISPQDLPNPPAGMTWDEFEQWVDMQIELAQATEILNVQLAGVNNTPGNHQLAWDFWYREVTRSEFVRNRHVFTYHGQRRADGENAESIRELVQKFPGRIRALETVVRNRSPGTAVQVPVPISTPVRSMAPVDQPMPPTFIPGMPASAQPAMYAQATPVRLSAAQQAPSPPERPLVPYPTSPVPPSTTGEPACSPSPVRGPHISPGRAELAAIRERVSAPRPLPSAYPLIQRGVPNRMSPAQVVQPQNPTHPNHAVFLYWNRDLSNTTLPSLPNGTPLFERDARNLTDRGWGPGIRVHLGVQSDVDRAAREHREAILR